MKSATSTEGNAEKHSSLTIAKEFLFLAALLALGISVFGVINEGLLRMGGILPGTESPLKIWIWLLLASIWLFVSSAVCKAVEVIRGY